ncbi:MAG TPA: hypothetical protein VGG09_03095 [Acidimicrobiales bacterium]
MAEPAAGEGVAWRTIDELAGLVGAYCWLEHRLFELTGTWAIAPGPGEADPGEAELGVWCAAVSRRRGDLAGRWAERLPVRAGVDVVALVAPPERPEGLARALDELAEAGTEERKVGVAGLVGTVLPWVGGVYSSDLAAASPVREASVMEVLVEARRDGSAEIRGGQSLLRRLPESGKPSRHLGTTFERAFSDSGVFPAVRPS